MSDDKVIRIAEALDDAKKLTPEQALDIARRDIGKREAFKDGKKLLILALDDTDGGYSVSFVQAGMKMSECNNLCDIASTIFKREMGYI